MMQIPEELAEHYDRLCHNGSSHRDALAYVLGMAYADGVRTGVDQFWSEAEVVDAAGATIAGCNVMAPGRFDIPIDGKAVKVIVRSVIRR